MPRGKHGRCVAASSALGTASFPLVFDAGFGDDGFRESRVGRRERARWGLVYEEGVTPSKVGTPVHALELALYLPVSPYISLYLPKVGTPVHALELAHAAKFNLDTTWGVGDSCVPGPDPHRRTGQPAGSGYVAVAGKG